MRVLILGGANSRNSGGIFNSAKQLGIHMNLVSEVEVSFLLHSDEYSKDDIGSYRPVKVDDYKIKGPSGFAYSSNLYGIVTETVPDIVHVQTLWMYLSWVNLRHHIKTGTPYVISPRGMLDKWQLRQSFAKDLKKSIALFFYERKHLENASCLNALCMEEYFAIRDFGLNNPVAIIPNGVNLPSCYSHEKGIYQSNEKTKKRLLFLSRIHKKKGLDSLIEAWSLISSKFPDWKLSIAGETKDRDYLDHLQGLVIYYGLENSIEFLGGMFGEDKRNIFIQSDAFILPSFSEGLPMAVLEAWSYRLPALITPYCNLKEGFESNAALEIGTDVTSIAEGISRLFEMNEIDRQSLGENGYNLVKLKFTWDIVSSKTLRLYNWILRGGDAPEFVILD